LTAFWERERFWLAHRAGGHNRGRTMSVFALLKFVIATAPIFIKVADYVLKAGQELAGKTGEEKRAWVMEKLKVELPNLNLDQLYNWVNSVVYLLRNMGKAT
jgi:hypothetical protein